MAVDDTKFPLRSGPTAADTTSFDEFMEVFHHQMYGQQLTEDDASWQVDGEDPVLEVEAIVAKKNKGKKTQYLVKWVGPDKKTWEPLGHLKGAKEEIQRYEVKKKSKANLG